MFNVTLDYYGSEQESMDWDAFEKLWPGEVQRNEGIGSVGWTERGPFRMTSAEIEALLLTGAHLSLTPYKNTMFVPISDSPPLNRGDIAKEAARGNVTNTHIPNVGLLAIDEVIWLENACTELLQEALDTGWRILAVCPPNAQRRPDYILGRSKASVTED
jgi:hypothetical protein